MYTKKEDIVKHIFIVNLSFVSFNISEEMQEVFIDEVSPEEILSDTFITSLFHENEVKITFLFRSYFTNTKILRELITKLFACVWVSVLWQNRFMLIIDELNNNAIEYGSQEWDLNKMRVVILKKEQDFDISIEVEDSGNWKAAKNSQQMMEIQEQKLQKWFEDYHSIRGRWLFLIIHKLVDQLYFQDADDAGLIVWVQKHISAS